MAGPIPIPIAERFWKHVDRSAGPNACWPWTGAVNKVSGYPVFRVSRKVVAYAHRVAFALRYGKVPDGMVVHHKCYGSPLCCNNGDDHLAATTKKFNDAEANVRRWRGGDPCQLDLSEVA